VKSDSVQQQTAMYNHWITSQTLQTQTHECTLVQS